jgi:Fic family protein
MKYLHKGYIFVLLIFLNSLSLTLATASDHNSIDGTDFEPRGNILDSWVSSDNLLREIRTLCSNEDENADDMIREQYKQLFNERELQYVYHTNALEGNAMTYEHVQNFIQDKIFSFDVKERDYMEAIGAFDALMYAKINISEYVSEQKPFVITHQFLNDLHYHFFRFIDRPHAGKFREENVVVSGYHCPEHEKLPELMEEFINWLNSEEAKTLHPIKKAALAHYQLAWIHPYVDGNGRTARLLMNVILMLHNYPLIIIPNTIKETYFNSLALARNERCHDIMPFLQLITNVVKDNLTEVLKIEGN